MIARSLSLFALTLSFSLSAAATPADDVNALFKSLGDAFNKNDAKAASMLFAEDGDAINPAGVMGKGRAGVEKIIGDDMKTILKGVTNKFTVDSSRDVGGGTWLVDATHEAQNMHMPDGKMGTGKIHLVAIVSKGKDGKLQFAAARPYMFLPPPPAMVPAAPAKGH